MALLLLLDSFFRTSRTAAQHSNPGQLLSCTDMTLNSSHGTAAAAQGAPSLRIVKHPLLCCLSTDNFKSFFLKKRTIFHFLHVSPLIRLKHFFQIMVWIVFFKSWFEKIVSNHDLIFSSNRNLKTLFKSWFFQIMIWNNFANHDLILFANHDLTSRSES